MLLERDVDAANNKIFEISFGWNDLENIDRRIILESWDKLYFEVEYISAYARYSYSRIL